VSERYYDLESQKLQWLKEEQLKEKREIMDKYLPMDSVIRDINREIAEEEERELQEFKREQEIERQRKMQEIEKQRQALIEEMQEQKNRLEKAASENRRLELEEKKRE
jgi:Cu2+-containing amine oxidase